jgi:AmmeMemoRadiSam system protein A
MLQSFFSGGIMEKEFKRKLLLLAHESIREELDGNKSEMYPILLEEYRNKDQDPVGLFVTLHTIDSNGSLYLRGCIGTIEGVYSLIDGVYWLAKESAFEDPRFLPLTLHEFKHIHIQISILSELKEIESIDDIILGTHGVVYQYRHHRALFLPEVAIEQHWTKLKLLNQLCIKASLPQNHYQEGEGKLFIFTSISFEDEYEKKM